MTSLLTLRRSWSSLTCPQLDSLVGDLEASFVAPLRKIAPAGLGLIGLPDWFGKRFAASGDALEGVNLVRRPGGLEPTLPMTARVGTSYADGRPAVVISYAADAPRPWRWVRDEVRAGGDGTLVGMTYVDVPGLRAAGGTPFILTPVPRGGGSGA
jgi:cholesterol oxidase